MKNFIVYILVLIIIIIVSIFFIPLLITIYKTKKKLNNTNLTLNNYNRFKKEYFEKLYDLKNISEILQKTKNEEISKQKELVKVNGFYGQSIDEVISGIHIENLKTNEMKGIINLYENNNISSYNTIKNLKNFFKNHKIEEFWYNFSNILLVSSILKNQSDIDFIYNEIIRPFFPDNYNEYILGSPCYKTSIDSNQPYIFHKRCDKYKNTIMLIKTNKTRFGGITDLSWGGREYAGDENYENTKTKLFNLDNKKIFKYNKNQENLRYIRPIMGDNNYIASFGFNDIYLDCLPWESSSNFPMLFICDDEDKDFNFLLNEKIKYKNDNIFKFEYLDIEVYPIIEKSNKMR